MSCCSDVNCLYEYLIYSVIIQQMQEMDRCIEEFMFW